MSTITTIDAYINQYPEDVKNLLRKMRAVIAKEAPGAEEKIGYGIPTFTLKGKNLVHFGAAKKHIGFYPTPSAIEHFQKELSAYEGAKGSVQFTFDKPLPLDLIKKIVQYRLKEIQK